jgi:hypothetical protein
MVNATLKADAFSTLAASDRAKKVKFQIFGSNHDAKNALLYGERFYTKAWVSHSKNFHGQLECESCS